MFTELAMFEGSLKLCNFLCTWRISSPNRNYKSETEFLWSFGKDSQFITDCNDSSFVVGDFAFSAQFVVLGGQMLVWLGIFWLVN